MSNLGTTPFVGCSQLEKGCKFAEFITRTDNNEVGQTLIGGKWSGVDSSKHWRFLEDVDELFYLLRRVLEEIARVTSHCLKFFFKLPVCLSI